MNDFNMNERAITDYLNDPYGPIGDMLADTADQVAIKARATAPVRSGTLWNNSASPTSNARPSGFLKASIHAKRGVSMEGNLYGSVNAEADPLVFIAYPAKHIAPENRNLFMQRALYSTRV